MISKAFKGLPLVISLCFGVSHGATVVAHYPLGRYHLFYVSLDEKERKRFDIGAQGAFFLLDAADSSLSDLDVIYKKAKAAIEVDDYDRALGPEQVKIEDIDEGCEGNTGPEVLVRLYGPSEDPGLIILGFDRYGIFRKLFHESGQLLGIHKIAQNRLEIVLNVREDLAGTMYHRQSFLFDTENKLTYKVPHVFVERSHRFLGYDMGSWRAVCIKRVPVYFDPRSAVFREPIALIGWIREGWKVSFERFYRVEGKGAAFVQSDSLSGWVNQWDVNWENFELPAAD